MPWFGGSKRAPIPRVPTDRVVPAHVLDNDPTTRSIIFGYAFRFNQVLDCNRLHIALSRLLEIGEWRKLGGRIRLDEKGRQEIHIPQKFTAERPAVHYTRVSYPDIEIDQHPVASRFPRPPTDGAPALLSGYDDYIDLMEPDKTLHSSDDFLYSDRPQLSLHCVTFRDATLVILKLPHSTVDVMGFRALLVNWSRVLTGREDLVQPLADPDKDVVAKIAELDATATQTLPPHPRPEITVAGQRQLAGLGLVIFILRFIFLLVFGDKPISGMLFLPAKTIQIMKTQARRDLEAEPPASDTASNGEKGPLFVSESDLLAAWTSRLTLSTESPSSTQDVAIMNMVDMRGRVPEVFGEQPSPNGPVWVQNLVLPSITHLTVKTLLSQPLGKTSMQLRASVREQATPEAFSRYCAHIKPILDKGGMMPVFFKRDSIIFAVSSWHSAKLFETVDFSAAVVEDHRGAHATGIPWAKQGKPGKPVSICPVGFSHNPELRNSWGVVGRDSGGNYWLHGMITRKAWDNVARELERLKGLEDQYVLPDELDK